MITGSQEYQEFLSNIAETAPSVLKMRIPTNEPVYQIDWNTRKITAPPFIGVEGDHEAECVFFEMDRYYDMMDLAETVGMIIFKNAKNEEYYQLIPYYDIYSINGKIIFPWVIQAPAALYGGIVQFSFKFFKINPFSSLTTEEDGRRAPKRLIYELNTLIGKTKVLTGWANQTGNYHTYSTLNPESILVTNDTLQNLNDLLALRKKMAIYWMDADSLVIEDDNNEYAGGEQLQPALPGE